MTEAEWLACDDPEQMLAHVAPDASERKLRLFGVACCRRMVHILADVKEAEARWEDYRQAVDVAERYADRQASARELTEARFQATDNLFENSFGWDPFLQVVARDHENLASILTHITESHYNVNWGRWLAGQQSGELLDPDVHPDAITLHEFTSDKYKPEIQIQLQLIRCLFGNPFRRFKLPKKLRTATAVALAAQMYESRDFALVPILGDALQDAGCGDAAVIAHCCDDGPHARGCWVVDLVLGKS